MKNANLLKPGAALVLSALCLGLAGCQSDSATSTDEGDHFGKTKLRDYSVTPALVKSKDIAGLEFYSIISSDDTLEDTPTFRFGGSADGMGIVENPDKSLTMVVNHEDNFAVSRITLDKKFKPVAGEYLMNSTNGRWRLCSATLVTPEEHGFGPLYLTCGESGEESMTHGIDPLGPVGQTNPLPALGRWSAENAVPLPKSAYHNKTIVLIGDDDSGPMGGQLVMYVGNRTGDLANGNLYVLCRPNNNIRERDMVPGQRYEVTFRQIPNHQALTGAQINAASGGLSSVRFGRVEDIDYRKGDEGREVYFNVTGQATSGANADYSRTKYGRVYRLTLDANDPTKGSLEVILDGDDRSGIAKAFQNPDNILVTENYAYIQEDPNGYGDETHDAYIYQYDIRTGALKVAMELDHRRGDVKYNAAGPSRFGSWEYGAMIDIKEFTKHNDAFAICIQPHTWTGPQYVNPDGGALRPNENQASQIVIVKGLAR